MMIPLVGGVSLDPPFEDPVMIVALAMVVFLVAPLLLERYELPGIIGVIVAGAVVGPNALDLLRRSETIVLLGEVGIIYLMFIAGLEIDLDDFIENADRSVTFGAISFAIPMALGTAAGLWLLDFSALAAVLFASVFASHTLLAYPIVNQLGIVKNEAVTAVIGGTILTDTLALLVLAVVSGATQGQLDAAFWAQLGGGLVVFFAVVWTTVPRVGRWFFRNLDEESYFEFLFVMAVLFVSSFLAEVAGVEAIIGAFLAGLALNRLVPSTGTLMNRIEFVGNALFIPFFLLSVGMLVDVRVFLGGLDVWLIAGSTIAALVVGKLAAVIVASRIYGYDGAEWKTMFGLSTGQAAAALAITLIGSDIGLFGEPTVNGVVLMILVVSVASPYLTERFGREIVQAEAQGEYEPSDRPERILLPLTKRTENADLLLDLAMLLRGDDDSAEPIRALTVVEDEGDESSVEGIGAGVRREGTPGDGGQTAANGGAEGAGGVEGTDESDESDTESEVADAERTLESAEEYAAGAEVPVETQTRVDANVVTGIVRAIRDNRITTVVIGWNGRRGFGQRVFGTTIERLVDRTRERVLVANLNGPINATERVVIVLSGRAAANPGFYGGIHAAKTIAEELGSKIHCLLVDGDPDQYERLVASVEPEVPFEIETVSSWSQLGSGDRFEGTDLVVPIRPRRGARGWDRGLERAQRDLAERGPENLIVLYLAEEEGEPNRKYLLRT
ncbi:cation:proton antiporter [Halegenticoccus tardaugens]|uniref:cation:proton antiporter n=1 Tax=Halegenticoccus tardaugens TaxID=2071624 RepID=UPI00100A7904|nr:cation:proton antiporter [Halegenticoccus tardaugens]